MIKKHTAVVCAACLMAVFNVFANDTIPEEEWFRYDTTSNTAIQSNEFEGVSRRVDFVESLNKEKILDSLTKVERVMFQIGTVYKDGADLKISDFEFPQKIGETVFYRKDGQFFCNNDASIGQGCPIRIKLGNEKPFTIQTKHPKDVSNNHYLIVAPKDAMMIAGKIDALVDNDKMTAKEQTMTVIIPSYSVGEQKFVFHVGTMYCLPFHRQCQ